MEFPSFDTSSEATIPYSNSEVLPRFLYNFSSFLNTKILPIEVPIKMYIFWKAVIQVGNPY